MKHSEFQMAIYDSIKSRKRNITINAVAGSGKTTTIISSLDYLPNSSTLMVAFNKSIELELYKRLNRRACAATFHKLGLWTVSKHLGRVEVDPGKSSRLLKRLLPEKRYSEIGSSILELTGMSKRYGVLPADMDGVGCMVDHPDTWDYLINKFDIPVTDDNREEVIDVTRKLLLSSMNYAEGSKVIDFDDMIYIPVIKNCSVVSTYSTIFIDEAQDVSPTRIRLATMALESNGRIIAVGDRRQAIYGFTGADSESMDNIREQFDSLELPLSVCYRCDDSIIALANKIVPEITARDGADSGTVSKNTGLKVTDVTKGDLILCRSNAPLLQFCYKLISSNIPCTIIGRDIGEWLVSFIKSMRAKGLDGLKDKLDAWLEKETEKHISDKRLDKLEVSKDKYNCVHAFLGNPKINSVPDLTKTIQDMFLDTPKDDMVVLSSVHRAKGLEAERVHILNYDKMPSSLAKQPWQKEQEMNIKYVAITRAKHYLNLEYVK